jgi:outer membrane murein-binding lipoprotein Lpp
MRSGAIAVLAALVGACILSGCIADTAEDTDLPWATNKKWEGIAPISPTITDRYD